MKNFISKAWKIINGFLAAIFACLIVEAWIQILYFARPEKHYYYIATLFIVPFVTCLIVVFGWDLDERKG